MESISKEMNNDNDLNLHSLTKLSGWLLGNVMLKSSLNITNAMHKCCKRSEVSLISSYLLGSLMT